MSDWRPATPADVVGLADLERDANLAALGHVFPRDEHPFPYDDVLERWRSRLAEDVTVEVVGGDGRLDAFLAHDTVTLRHLAVHPDRWGTGLARAGVARATAAGAHRLWCLVDNHRARGLYDHLGWRPTGARHPAEWPPYPTEMEYRAAEDARRG